MRAAGLLEHRSEPDLDGIVDLTATVCGTPVALVSVPDGPSLCAHTVRGHGLLVVPDARADARFADLPEVVAEPGVRFYAGVPLLTGAGETVGALCVTDAVPRRLGLGQLRALRALARQVTTLFDLRLAAARAGRETAARHETERLHDELVPLLAGDLRRPLAELRHYVELLRDVEFCPAEVAARLGAATHAYAPDLLRLLDNLLRMAVATGTPADRRDLDLNTLVEWAVREVRPIAEARDIHLRLDAGPAAPVTADPRGLALALCHLVFSAVKFTPPAGRIHIRVTGTDPVLELRALGLAGTPATLFPHLVNGALGRPTTVPGEDAGLAAVKVVLDAHHATVALCDAPTEGTATRIAFPSAG